MTQPDFDTPKENGPLYRPSLREMYQINGTADLESTVTAIRMVSMADIGLPVEHREKHNNNRKGKKHAC